MYPVKKVAMTGTVAVTGTATVRGDEGSEVKGAGITTLASYFWIMGVYFPLLYRLLPCPIVYAFTLSFPRNLKTNGGTVADTLNLNMADREYLSFPSHSL